MTGDRAGASPSKPIALVVLLENVGHVAGVSLPGFVMSAIDFLTEEYAKLLLHYYGAYRIYDRVIILEDELATGAYLSDTILRVSRSHRIDLLLLVHGKEEKLVGHRGQELIGAETFDALLAARRKSPTLVDLRMVFGLNCYGASLVERWLQLGAIVANGTPGVNWLPEPSLSTFLSNWFGGLPYALAVQRSNERARRWGSHLWRNGNTGREHPKLESSRQVVYGDRDITIHTRV